MSRLENKEITVLHNPRVIKTLRNEIIELTQTFEKANKVYPLFIAVENITGIQTTIKTSLSYPLIGTVTPNDATNQNILWRIKDTGTTYASISGGSLSAVAIGTVVLRATVTNGATESTNYTQDFTIVLEKS